MFGTFQRMYRFNRETRVLVRMIKSDQQRSYFISWRLLIQPVFKHKGQLIASRTRTRKLSPNNNSLKETDKLLKKNKRYINFTPTGEGRDRGKEKEQDTTLHRRYIPVKIKFLSYN